MYIECIMQQYILLFPLGTRMHDNLFPAMIGQNITLPAPVVDDHEVKVLFGCFHFASPVKKVMSDFGANKVCIARVESQVSGSVEPK